MALSVFSFFVSVCFFLFFLFLFVSFCFFLFLFLFFVPFLNRTGQPHQQKNLHPYWTLVQARVVGDGKTITNLTVLGSSIFCDVGAVLLGIGKNWRAYQLLWILHTKLLLL